MNIQPRSFGAATLCISTLLLASCQDTDLTGVDRRQAPPLAGAMASSAQQGTMSFTIGPLVITGIEQKFPSDNWHLRDVQLTGPVSGDLTGQANMSLNANLDGFIGSGPAWGTVSVVSTTGDVWEGSFTGKFQSGLPALGIQLFASVVLRGPEQQKLKVECDETTATSETLVCTGEVLRPHE